MFALADCNNFYASCERVFRPGLREKAIVILSNNDGCIIARSNEAKALGIAMGAPLFKVQDTLRKHHVHVFSSNYAFYGDMSRRVMNTLKTFCSSIELYSIDEAFLDLGDLPPSDLQEYGCHIRETVLQYTGMPVSLGIASTKTLAKLANKIAKKEKTGVYSLLNRMEEEAALSITAVEDIWGIGSRYSHLLKKNGVHTALDLSSMPDQWVRKHLSVTGLRLVRELRGEACLSLEWVVPAKKGIGSSRSFKEEIGEYEKLESKVAIFTARCAEKLRHQSSVANLISVFVKTNSFKKELPQYRNLQVVRLPMASSYTPELCRYALAALKRIYREGFSYKKAGVMLTGIVPNDQVQQSLFSPLEDQQKIKQQKLMKVMDQLNLKMGRQTLHFAVEGTEKINTVQTRLSPCYTTRWEDLPLIWV